MARLAARREPALDPLPADNADCWRAVRALPNARPGGRPLLPGGPVDPADGKGAQVPGAFRAADLAVGAEGVWAYDQRQGAVAQIDPGTNRVVRTIPVISQPLVELHSYVLALGDGAVWVVDKGGQAVVRVDPNR